ncbi:MAG: hypothetical protein U0903_20675 [Planctomycetales bacterium]
MAEILLAHNEGMVLLPIVPEGSGYAVGWFTLALINAGLAQSKNRSGLAWFLVSLLAGPLATFLLVAFCDRKPNVV